MFIILVVICFFVYFTVWFSSLTLMIHHWKAYRKTWILWALVLERLISSFPNSQYYTNNCQVHMVMKTSMFSSSLLTNYFLCDSVFSWFSSIYFPQPLYFLGAALVGLKSCGSMWKVFFLWRWLFVILCFTCLRWTILYCWLIKLYHPIHFICFGIETERLLSLSCLV